MTTNVLIDIVARSSRQPDKVKGFVNPPEEWFQLWTPWVEA